MPRTAAPSNALQPLVEEFVRRIVGAVEAATAQRVQGAVMAALAGSGMNLPRRRGRPPKNPALFGGVSLAPAKPRQKQLCPVPGCTNPAAPVFGMVCAQHKGVSKAKIKKYRAERRASKNGARTGAPRRARRQK